MGIHVWVCERKSKTCVEAGQLAEDYLQARKNHVHLNNSGMDLDKSSTTRYFWCGLVCPWEAQHAFLVPLPVADSSHQVVIDIVGPLAQTWSGNHYIQVVCNYTTCYQEALTLRSVDPKHIMKELVKSAVFERVSILSRCLMPPHVICVGRACIAHA